MTKLDAKLRFSIRIIVTPPPNPTLINLYYRPTWYELLYISNRICYVKEIVANLISFRRPLKSAIVSVTCVPLNVISAVLKIYNMSVIKSWFFLFTCTCMGYKIQQYEMWVDKKCSWCAHCWRKHEAVFQYVVALWYFWYSQRGSANAVPRYFHILFNGGSAKIQI